MNPALRLALASTLFAVSAAAQAAPTFINILTGGTSGVYYPVGVGISQIDLALEIQVGGIDAGASQLTQHALQAVQGQAAWGQELLTDGG